MSVIRMSPLLTNLVSANFMMKSSGGYLDGSIVRLGLLVFANSQSDSYYGARIAIMQGTVPTDFSTLTSLSTRAADVLITYETTPTFASSGGFDNFEPSQTSANPIVITTTYRPALATGTATWFWWTIVQCDNTPGAPYYFTTTAPVHQLFGTVGTTGSSSDLEFASTSIVAGQLYRISNLRLQLPTSWTY